MASLRNFPPKPTRHTPHTHTSAPLHPTAPLPNTSPFKVEAEHVELLPSVCIYLLPFADILESRESEYCGKVNVVLLCFGFVRSCLELPARAVAGLVVVC